MVDPPSRPAFSNGHGVLTGRLAHGGNGERVAERHVPVAHGRDYADVTPLKGASHGAPAEATGVAVELTRVGETAGCAVPSARVVL